jgi:hypothetical protein
MPGDTSTIAELDKETADESQETKTAPNMKQTYMKAMDLIEANGGVVAEPRKFNDTKA